MGRKVAFDYTKDRRKERRKQKKEVIVQNEIIKRSWDNHLSVKSNFKRFGLLFNPNETIHRSDSEIEDEEIRETKTIKELKNVKNSKKRRERFISEDDRLFCMYMLELYGSDYESMSRDSKNVYQLTPTQIQRKIEVFRRSKHFKRYLNDKKSNNLHVLELYE
ncbi:hypothetical protein Aperf_G00000024014 [Anoplocephala perfoliata]